MRFVFAPSERALVIRAVLFTVDEADIGVVLSVDACDGVARAIHSIVIIDARGRCLNAVLLCMQSRRKCCW